MVSALPFEQIRQNTELPVGVAEIGACERTEGRIEADRQPRVERRRDRGRAIVDHAADRTGHARARQGRTLNEIDAIELESVAKAQRGDTARAARDWDAVEFDPSLARLRAFQRRCNAAVQVGGHHVGR